MRRSRPSSPRAAGNGKSGKDGKKTPDSAADAVANALTGKPTRGNANANQGPMASTAVQSGLQLYLRQINESPLLTADEEKSLARKIIHENDPAARERMVRS